MSSVASPTMSHMSSGSMFSPVSVSSQGQYQPTLKIQGGLAEMQYVSRDIVAQQALPDNRTFFPNDNPTAQSYSPYGPASAVSPVMSFGSPHLSESSQHSQYSHRSASPGSTASDSRASRRRSKKKRKKKHSHRPQSSKAHRHHSQPGGVSPDGRDSRGPSTTPMLRNQHSLPTSSSSRPQMTVSPSSVTRPYSSAGSSTGSGRNVTISRNRSSNHSRRGHGSESERESTASRHSDRREGERRAESKQTPPRDSLGRDEGRKKSRRRREEKRSNGFDQRSNQAPRVGLRRTPSTLPPSSHYRWAGDRSTRKSETSIHILREALNQELLFQELPQHSIERAIQEMYRVNVPTFQFIIQQGEVGDAYFVVETGSFDILVHEGDDEENVKLVGEIATGESFGEGSLLYSNPRGASLRAKEDCCVWALDKETFMDIRRMISDEKKRKVWRIVKFLSRVPLLSTLTEQDLVEVAYVVREARFGRGSTIVTQGDASTHFYIIRKGEAIVTKETDGNDRMVVMEYGPHDYFGELGIMENQPRAATVEVVSEQVACLVIKAEDFNKLLKIRLEAPLQQTIQTYSNVNTSFNNDFTNQVACELDEFADLGVLGVGSFGRVSLVKDPQTNKTYSLKKIRKNRVVETGQQDHMRNERQVMAVLDSNFCVKLFGTYRDGLNVYFLMEPILGGELFTVLRYNRRFSEKTARFYAGCVILAFEHLHSKNIIYRDIKPENLLISQNGYCKLVDFGFAKLRNSTCTLCGTPEYLAPEVIRSWTQSFAVDWWGVGILIYEMVVGHPPFQDDAHMKMYEKILTSPVQYPSHVSHHARDLVDQLLRKNAYSRLGSGIAGAKAVKNHVWFKGLDWDKMDTQEVEPPYIPRIRDDEDVSNYEHYPDENIDEELLPDPTGELFKWCLEF